MRLARLFKFMRRTVARVDVLVFAFCIALFVTFGTLDREISQYFYNAESGFFWADHRPVVWTYLIFADLQWAILIVLLGALWFGRKLTDHHRRIRLRSSILFLFVSLLLGPGLIVNELVKKQSGRIRPNDTVIFGGHLPEQKTFDFSGSCRTNCSFVSGHASLGFWFISLAWTLGQRRYFWLGLLLGCWVGFGRMLQGDHYLSDVVFAFWCVYGMNWLIAKYFRIQLPQNF